MLTRIASAPREPGTSSSPRSRTAASPGPRRRIPCSGRNGERGSDLRALARRDAVLEERYLFHACVSRPTERLWLSWRSSDEEGRPSTRSPFIDDVLDRLGPVPDQAELELKEVHGLDRVVFRPDEAPSRRQLERAVAAIAPRVEPVLPGPLADPAILAELAERDPVGPELSRPGSSARTAGSWTTS